MATGPSGWNGSARGGGNTGGFHDSIDDGRDGDNDRGTGGGDGKGKVAVTVKVMVAVVAKMLVKKVMVAGIVVLVRHFNIK